MTEVEKLMKSLDISKEEAMQIIADDKAIEQGEKLFELTPEQAKASKIARQAPRAKGVYNFNKRKRKSDEQKRKLLDKLIAVCDEVEVLNPEREFIFYAEGKKFKVTLSAPRT